jgi:hypothetical protein
MCSAERASILECCVHYIFQGLGDECWKIALILIRHENTGGVADRGNLAELSAPMGLLPFFFSKMLKFRLDITAWGSSERALAH